MTQEEIEARIVAIIERAEYAGGCPCRAGGDPYLPEPLEIARYYVPTYREALVRLDALRPVGDVRIDLAYGHGYDVVVTRREPPADVWCARCDLASIRVVRGEAYCETHAGIADWNGAAS